MRNARRKLAALVVVVLASGCGGVRTYPVEGQVVWADGSPATELAGGMVLFDLSGDAKERYSPKADIKPDGSYRLTTFSPYDGAPPGKYNVVVTPVIWTEGMLGDKPAPPQLLDGKYQDLRKPQIEVTVEPRPNTIPLKVTKVKR